MVDSTKIVRQRNFWRTKFTPKNLFCTKFSKILRQIFPYEKFVGIKIGVNLRKEMSLAAVSWLVHWLLSPPHLSEWSLHHLISTCYAKWGGGAHNVAILVKISKSSNPVVMHTMRKALIFSFQNCFHFFSILTRKKDISFLVIKKNITNRPIFSSFSVFTTPWANTSTKVNLLQQVLWLAHWMI